MANVKIYERINIFALVLIVNEILAFDIFHGIRETLDGGNRNFNDLPSAVYLEWVPWKYEKWWISICWPTKQICIFLSQVIGCSNHFAITEIINTTEMASSLTTHRGRRYQICKWNFVIKDMHISTTEVLIISTISLMSLFQERNRPTWNINY